MKISTCDLCDEYAKDLKVADPIGLKDYGGRKNFYGKIQTIRCFENNPKVREALSQDGYGKVLVVDGGGSLKCALLGDNIGELAISNHWNGIIVFGCIRDSVALSKLDIGIKALNTNPLKSRKENEGEVNVSVDFAGIDFHPDHYVYCDGDGIIVSKLLFEK